ncbi:sarcosine oxidase subunit alpha family protein [Aestuariivirga litoralis]|uniref:sarcosine oxidase subunit alpha family protein n=1 Tax=Aestuariivirga litoralis TaxID=2650924 RepID=UPI0018C5EF7B|nr:sarcosine oxidase subunit alpha family protein [Aestuariivirga litoralis]MBG1232215.1 sarcosine oxidase subunit alpha family protein [Aestuariivirga litoralis]
MTGKPYRLSEGGSRIDRTNRLTISFDGRDVPGFAGDTVASAVLASGQKVFGRSFKYHRPRGLVGLGSEEMNALIGVGADNRHEPNLRASQIEVFPGLVAESQNRWPSLNFDIGALNSKLSRFFPGGFYYKTFMWPRAFWKHVYEPIIRRAAGLGRAAKGRDPDTYEHMHIHADVLVAGGGIAGILAAEAAAKAGAKVVLIDENPVLGGIADLTAGAINGTRLSDWLVPVIDALKAMPNVHVLTRTTVVGHYHHNFLMAAERVADHDPSLLAAGAPRQRLWKIRASQVILATGALERPIAFANNDRPNIMLASTARGLVDRYGVSPGTNGVVFTNNDDAYLTAFVLKKAGVNVQVVDSRARPEGALVKRAEAEGIQVSVSSVISAVEGTMGVKSVKIAAYRKGQGRVITEKKVDCDFIAMSGGWNPALHLWAHNGGKIKFDDGLQSFRPDTHHAAMVAIGAANGTMSVADTITEAQAAGEAAAKATLKKAKAVKPSKIEVTEPQRGASESLWFAPATGHYNEGNKHFIDFQNDVTAADLELAQREGYESVEHTKRYTTFGMATDQGKTSNLNGLGVLSEATGKSIPQIGTTTFRPPYTPYSFGAIAGSLTNELFLPVRRTAIFNWHMEKGATWEPVGQWRRAYTYTRPGEDKHQSIAREILGVRNKVGLLDASTLGKIEIKGPDAAEFLDRVYTNTYSTLKVGKCRYGLMMNELGFLTDDGVTVRLGEDHFLMHTTSGGADRIAAWLEEWLQTEWTQYKVFVTPVTEQWSQFAMTGPHAREVLAKLDPDFDISNEAFPHMSFKIGKLGTFPVRVFRISFSGEQSYELATPTGYGMSLWKAIQDAGVEFGLETYGTEALHVLRAEKGYIVIGDETDGTTTPDDVGFGGMVSKKKPDFLGKRSLEQSYLKAANRKQLVGLLTEDPQEVLPDGAYAVAEVKDKPPMQMIGQVTSTYMSPTLGRSIAMALIENGRARMGETISFPLEGGKVVKAKITSTVFYDVDGGRISA